MARFAVGVSPAIDFLHFSASEVSSLIRIGLRIAFVIALSARLGSGQTDPNAGILPFSTQAHGVDLATSQVSFVVPIRSKVGSPPFIYVLIGNSHAFNYGAQWGVTYGAAYSGGL